MNYILFVDDVRDLTDTDAGYHFNDSTVVVCRSSSAAIEVVSALGMPSFMALDHDLGGDDTIMRFLRWLEAQGGACPAYTCHSMNPAGKANVTSFMQAWARCE